MAAGLAGIDLRPDHFGAMESLVGLLGPIHTRTPAWVTQVCRKGAQATGVPYPILVGLSGALTDHNPAFKAAGGREGAGFLCVPNVDDPTTVRTTVGDILTHAPAALEALRTSVVQAAVLLEGPGASAATVAAYLDAVGAPELYAAVVLHAAVALAADVAGDNLPALGVA